MTEENVVSKPKRHKGDPTILRNNAVEYRTMMDLAFDHAVYPQVLHNGHITVELLLKALHAKETGTHPDGHALGFILEQPLKTEPLFDDIKAAGLKKTFELLTSAWSMQYRYHGRPTEKADAETHLKAYKEAIVWIETRFGK